MFRATALPGALVAYQRVPFSIRSKSGSGGSQRKLLQPNHFVSTTALQTSLMEFITYYNQAAKPINWTYTTEKLEQKLGKLL